MPSATVDGVVANAERVATKAFEILISTSSGVNVADSTVDAKARASLSSEAPLVSVVALTAATNALIKIIVGVLVATAKLIVETNSRATLKTSLEVELFAVRVAAIERATKTAAEF